jgi:hypothetical protein
MSLDYTKTLLQTLKQYQSSQITLTFNNKSHIPLMSVCCLNNLYQVFYLESQLTETYEDIESAIFAIEKTVKYGDNKSLTQ